MLILLVASKTKIKGHLLFALGARVGPTLGCGFTPGEGAAVGPPGVGVSVCCPVTTPGVTWKLQVGVLQQGFR